MIKSRRVRRAGHVALIGDRRGAFRGFSEDHLEDLGIDGKIIIIIKWLFKKLDGGHGLD